MGGRALIAIKALFLIARRKVAVLLAVVVWINVLPLRVLLQLVALKSQRYQTGPLVGRLLARLLGRSYGRVALVVRGKDAVALRQRDCGGIQDILGRGVGARKDRIGWAGL